jgi:hypothetical protein
LRELAITNSLQQQQATAQRGTARGAGRDQIKDFVSVPIESVPSVSVLIRSCSRINPSTQTQMRNPFTFFPIQELGSPEGYNFENAKMGDKLTFRTVCGGEVVDFICHLNSTEVIYTVKNNLVCFFLNNYLFFLNRFKYINILIKILIFLYYFFQSYYFKNEKQDFVFIFFKNV